MEVKIIKQEKNTLDVEIDSLTIVELLRGYLNQEGAKMAAWKRDHPFKNPVLHIEADNPTKLLQKAIQSAEKDIDKLVDEFKKMK